MSQDAIFSGGGVFNFSKLKVLRSSGRLPTSIDIEFEVVVIEPARRTSRRLSLWLFHNRQRQLLVVSEKRLRAILRNGVEGLYSYTRVHPPSKHLAVEQFIVLRFDRRSSDVEHDSI